MKKHVDTVIVLSGLFGGLLWMNSKFNEIDKRLVRIETILYMKGLLPQQLASHKQEEK